MLAVLMIVPAVAMLAAARWIEVEKICRGGNGLFDAMSGDNGLLD